MQEDEFLWYKAQQKHYNVGDFVLRSIVVACVQTPHPPRENSQIFPEGRGGGVCTHVVVVFTYV